MHNESHNHVSNCSTDRAVSPVIGVVLMVAITVILAAAIGAFAFGLSPGTDSTAPIASLTIEGESGDSEVIVVHDGGDTVNLADTSLLLDGDQIADDAAMNETVRSGERVTIPTDQISSGELVLRYDPTGDILARNHVH